jgi:hypothetical protein
MALTRASAAESLMPYDESRVSRWAGEARERARLMGQEHLLSYWGENEMIGSVVYRQVCERFKSNALIESVDRRRARTGGARRRATDKDVSSDLAKDLRLSEGIQHIILDLEVLSHGQKDGEGKLVRSLVLDASL